jgi:endonuclease/exonuclease/phosphatase family metal-dependent hydrolase
MFPERSPARTERDYDAYRKYILQSNPDIVFFQEVGGPRSLQRILPEGYNHLISQQYHWPKRSAPDIFTAIAFKADRFILADVFNVQTGFAYEDDGAPRQTRDTVAIRLIHRGVSMWLLSVHLKSSCERQTLVELAAPHNPCLLLRRQLEAVAGVLPLLTLQSDVLVVGGDFNRRGFPNYEEDPYIKLLPSVSKHLRKTIALPGTRGCQTYLGAPKDPIDYFVVYAPQYLEVKQNAVVTEILWDENDLRQGYKLSDHCPVLMDWRIPSTLSDAATQ